MNEKQMERFARRARTIGKTADDYTQKRQRDYLDGRSNKNCEAVAYQEYCLIFDKDRCVTLYPLPQSFSKKPLFDGKRQIAKPNRYTKMYDYHVSEIKEYFASA